MPKSLTIPLKYMPRGSIVSSIETIERVSRIFMRPGSDKDNDVHTIPKNFSIIRMSGSCDLT